MTQKILKQLYIGNKLFLNSNQEPLLIKSIRESSGSQDKLVIDIGTSEPIIFNKRLGIFKQYNNYDGTKEISVYFNSKNHRTRYLKREIQELKKENEKIQDKMKGNWAKIISYQSELMGL